MLWHGPWVLQLVLTHLKILGTSTCPTPQQVQAQLDALVPVDSGEDVQHGTVESVPDGLRLKLEDQGRMLGERRLSAEGSCADLAQAAAVIFATWQPEQPHETAIGPPRLVAQSQKPPFRPELISKPQSDWSVGVMLGGSLSRSEELAPALALVGSLGRSDSRWSGQGEILLQGDRSMPLGEGEVHWQRFWLGAGPKYRLLASGPLILEGQASLLLALAYAHAEGVPTPLDSIDPDLGLEVGLRLALFSRPWILALRLGLIAWPIPHRLILLNSSAVESLPPLEGLATLELAFGG